MFGLEAVPVSFSCGPLPQKLRHPTCAAQWPALAKSTRHVTTKTCCPCNPAHCRLLRGRRPSQDEAPVLAAVAAGRRNWRAAAHALYGAPGAGNALINNEPGPGVVLYLLPMGAGQGKGGSSHGWGTPTRSFWCCHGSSVESFAKLADSIYFHRRGAGLAMYHPSWKVLHSPPSSFLGALNCQKPHVLGVISCGVSCARSACTKPF